MALRCPHCAAHAVVRPNPLWRLANVAAWGYAFLSVAGASLIGPTIMVVVPALLFGGMCLVTETHRRATEPVHCEACGRYVHGLAPASRRPVLTPARVRASA
jgi:hypothetical protein